MGKPIIIMGLALGACCQGLAFAEAQGFGLSHDRGFSYFLGVGRQTLHYSEEAAMVRARSSARASSALLITGAVYAVHPDLLVALDNTTTFAPSTATESWRATASTVPYAVSSTQIEDRAVNGPLLQTNRFSLSQSNTRVLAQYRVRGPWFWVGGLAFRSQSFKRYRFDVLQPNVVNMPTSSVVEESSSEVLGELGLALESERVKDVPRHYGLRLSVATPFWRRLDNTSASDISFKGTKGWDLNLEGRYSFAINDMAHIGGWAQYAFSERGRQIKGFYELPRSQTRSTAIGIELLWKL